jgi:hypothetical protein
MLKRFIPFLVLLAAFPALAETTVWCVGESTKIKATDAPQEKNLAWNGATHTVTLGTARNEYVAFQIGVHADKDELQNVTLIPADLKGPGKALIPVADIDLFVEHYLNVTVTSRGDANSVMKQCTPGEHPTQMVPFSAKKFGAPFTVGAGRNQPVWVDIYIPDDATPGDYKGTFKVKAGEKELGDINVALTVWNFTLPQQTHFRSYLYTGPENLRWGHRIKDLADQGDPKFLELQDRYFQMAHQHRLNFQPLVGSGLEEVLDRYYKYYDGSGFTQRVGKGVGQNVACITPEGKSEEDFKNLSKKIVEQWERKKPTAILFAYMWDEPHDPDDFATSKQHCKWVHEAVGKKLLTFIATPQYQKYDAGDVNIYSEPSVEDIPKILERGDSVWAVNGGYGAGPYVDAPGYGGRSIVWMNWKMNLGGWQFWDCCYWVDKQNRKHKENKRWVKDMTYAQINADPDHYLEKLWSDPMNFDESRKKGYPIADAIRINGDGLLFYPGYDVGIDGPIASFAMKSLRRGSQDYEYLWLLKQAGKEKEIEPIVNSVCPAAGKWNEDPEAWEKARLDLAKLLHK